MQTEQPKGNTFEKDFVEELIKVLQELIKMDTRNLPGSEEGNETEAAEWVYNYLAKEGIDAEVIESAPGRGNVISRLKGTNSGASDSLLLLSHLDVVPPQDLNKWDEPPFSGVLKEGYVWGRGSIDMKGQTAPQLMTFLKLHREGIKPRGDIIFAATADEESGGHFGPGWLLEHKFDKIKADNVVTEGGGPLLPLKTKTPNYTIQVSEKGIFWTRLRTHGDAGHGSMPGPAKDMAIIKMMKVIEKIAKYKSPIIVQDLFRETVKAMDLPAAWLVKRIFTSKRLIPLGIWLGKKIMKEDVSSILYPLVQNKITPTILRAGDKENNIPGQCEVTLDIRTLPGIGREDVNDEIEKILGKKSFKEVEVEPIMNQPGGITPTGTDFYKKVEETISGIDPGAKLVPILSPGSTDMLHFRNRGIHAYGFVPMRLGDLSAKEFAALPHGYNERISVDNLKLAARFFYDLSLKY